MTIAQEAYLLIKEQPEPTVRAIAELLKRMSPVKKTAVKKRTGVANNKYAIDDAFDNHFDAIDEEIAKSFDGDIL